MAETTQQIAQPRKARNQTSGTQLSITGMTCGNCARHVTEAIQGVPGVRSASVSLDMHQALVHWDKSAGEPNIPAVVNAVEEAGYGAKVFQAETAPAEAGKMSGWRLNLWVGAIVTLFLMVGEWVFGLGMTPWFRWLAFGLATVVQFYAGLPFYRGAWSQLKVGNSNMDTLVALGSSTAYGYSTWGLLSGAGGHLYFMEAAAIITLISIGHWMEARVSARASGALRGLLNLAPAMARLRNASGKELEVPVAELEPGDVVALRPGDRVPTDAEVAEGAGAVDESMLTGESAPVEKEPGSKLYAGTANLNGRLIARVTAVGEETALAHIIAAVQRAQTSRANIQRLGDRVSSVFVPIVVSIAIAAGLWWGLAPESARAVHDWVGQFLWRAHVPATALAAAFIIAAAVLIIACPCAMGLATPAAIMAGSNAAARRGILIRDGVALEKAGHVTAVLFDKTGTLTAGKPVVVDTWLAPVASDTNAAVGLAAGLARHSSHPVSLAIARLAESEPAISGWEEVRGAGVRAISEVQGLRGEARLGSVRWLRETGVDLQSAQEFIKRWSSQGATITGVSAGPNLVAVFAVRDSLKPAARQVLERLRADGLKIFLVTGDNAATAASIATEAGIAAENVFAEVRPEQKAELVQKLQTQGERVAFVGDGINDAPALEQADLGVAVSRASDVAREAADIILLNSEIEAVPESLNLARATLRTIRQNLFWAFFYNSVGVPLAALGFMSPVLCAAAMGFSDLIVIGNALRLNHRKFT